MLHTGCCANNGNIVMICEQLYACNLASSNLRKVGWPCLSRGTCLFCVQAIAKKVPATPSMIAPPTAPRTIPTMLPVLSWSCARLRGLQAPESYCYSKNCTGNRSWACACKLQHAAALKCHAWVSCCINVVNHDMWHITISIQGLTSHRYVEQQKHLSLMGSLHLLPHSSL